MTAPKPVYYATISYRTPAGRRVLYGTLVAAGDLTKCANELLVRLANEVKYGRRRVAEVLGDFSAFFVAMQVAKKVKDLPADA